MLAARPRDVLTNDLRQPSRARTGIVAVGKHQVQFAPALAAFAQRQGRELAAFPLAAHGFLRKPRNPQAHHGRVDRSRLLAYRPALLRAEPAAAAALAARIANDQVAVLA